MNNRNPDPPTSENPFVLLAGGGEMGERTRAFDWSKTPVGPVVGWPQGLKSAVSICLGSRYPIVIWWGREDLTQFYNDGYTPMLGVTKHPKSLGQSAKVCWSEIWHIVGPMVESVFATGEATWSEDLLLVLDRNLPREEAYFTFSYSPIRDDAGAVGGIFCAVTETTGRVVGERRLRTLRDLGRTVTEAKSAEEACAVTARTLATNPADIPFALLYLLDDEAEQARLVATAGLEAGTGPASDRLDLSEPAAGSAVWPLCRVYETATAELVMGLPARFGPLPGGAWPDSPDTALVLPIAAPGQLRPTGFLISGLSPRRVVDTDYRSFFDLIAGQVATAVTNARAYEAEKRRAEALAEIDRVKTAFFSNVSHEFRTPLTLMLGPVEDILAKPADQVMPDNRHLLEVVNRNGLRLLRLVNTLLDFSRIEAGRVRAVFEPTDLAALTADLASSFRSACERAGLRLVVDCPPLAESVFVDREMWEKIVLNLLSNAFKFTFEGEIAVSVRRVGHTAELRVRDTGTGIPAEEMPRLFERFHRIENARGRTHEGSGIGLALVQELVKLHGGSITAESAVGQGTTFTLTVPLGSAHLPPDRTGPVRTSTPTATRARPYVEEALRWLPDVDREDDYRSALPSEGETDARGEEGTRTDRPRVLVADDNADMRRYIVRLLAEQYRVEAVPDGEAALAAARERPPDLILTDVMMPRLDGFDLLRELRADPRTNGLPVIMLSARAGEESRVEGMQAGADDYLVKPFSARELLARVSAHLQIARLRREAEQRLRGIFNQTTAGIAQVDLNGRFLFVNPRFCEMTGYSAEELQTQTCASITHPDHQACNESLFVQAVQERKSYIIEKRYIRKDGSPIWVRNDVSQLTDGNGRLASMLAVSLDITEQKRAEDRLRLLSEAAAIVLNAPDPDALLQTLFHKIGPTIGADLCFNYLVNDTGDGLRLATCVGVPEEMAGNIARLEFGQAICGTVALHRQPLAMACIQQSDDPKVQLVKSFGIRAYVCNPLMSGNLLLGTLSFASRSKDYFSADERAFLETICRYVAVAYERLRLVARLREADRRKDEFLATLAHELRNPLAPVRNGLQLLRRAEGNGELIEQSRTIMERQVSQMVRLVDDLLDVGRITRGKLELRREQVELAAVVKSAVETSRPLIEQMGHELTITLPPQPVYLDADPVRLSQVYLNLLNNAAKYTEPGGHIWLTAERQDSDAVVTVKDTGVGIPAEKLPHVFDIFTQVDQSLERSQGGLGLGLTLVKRLTEMHGGSVEAKSGGPGTGSTFTVRLPVAPGPAAAEPPPTEETAFIPHRRILIVDDNRDGADSLALMLRLLGNRVQMAYDGIEAVQAAEGFRPDVVLLDIGLPRLNGYEACRRIREQPWSKDMVLIAVTGWGQDEDKRRSLEAGFNFHMVKPVDPTDLEKLLAGLQAATA